MYFIVYGAGYQFEKSICKALWRTFIERKGAGRHELDTDFFKTFWSNRIVWN